MKRRHSIDNEFGERLQNYSLEPPMHIWDKIDQKRNWKHKLLNHFRQHKLIYSASSFSITLLVAVLILFPFANPKVQFFPIPLAEANATLVADHAMEESVTQAQVQLSNNSIEEKSQSIDEANSTLTTIINKKLSNTTVKGGDNDHSNLAVVVENLSAEIEEKVIDTEEKIEISIAEVAEVQEEEELVEPIEEQTAQTNNILNAYLLPNDLKLLETNYSLGKKLRITDTECAKFGPKKGQVFIDFLLSPDIALREMSPRNAEYTEYLRAREASESSVFAYSAGLRLSVVSGMGFVMRSGINYSQINEKFEHVDENYERTEIIKITNSAGEVIGMDTIVEYGTRIRTTHNRLQTIDLPIILGYELYYEKFAFSINGGPYLNLKFSQKGSFLSPTDLQPVSFSSDDPNAIKAFKKQLGIGWYGSLGFQYNLEKKLFLLIEPYFKIYPKSFTDENFAVRQRYFTTGLSIGIRRQL